MWTTVILLTATDLCWLTPAEDLFSYALKNWCNLSHSSSRVLTLPWGSIPSSRSAGVEFALNLKSSHIEGHWDMRHLIFTDPWRFLSSMAVDSCIFSCSLVGHNLFLWESKNLHSRYQSENLTWTTSPDNWTWWKQKVRTENVLPENTPGPQKIPERHFLFLDITRLICKKTAVNLQLSKIHRSKLCPHHFKQFSFLMQQELCISRNQYAQPSYTKQWKGLGLGLAHTLLRGREYVKLSTEI